MGKYNVFIDGACQEIRPNTHVGGWSFIITDSNFNIIKESYGKLRNGVQNSQRAELEALYQAILYMNENPNEYHIYSDYEVIVEGLNGYAKRKSNRDLWDKIEPLCLNMLGKINIEHIYSHQKNKKDDKAVMMNAKADKLARMGVNSLIIAPVNN